MANDLKKIDPDIYQAIEQEIDRQEYKLELIASENYVSHAVMEAQGSVLTNKYAEGYPGKRYYGGCENVDIVESLAKERVLKLFGAEAANVQPHSGSQANAAVFLASDLSARITGEVLYVDSGFNTVGVQMSAKGESGQ